jgi:MoaA/NifB/PqqE/SkfB family radical SAM enzyme
MPFTWKSACSSTVEQAHKPMTYFRLATDCFLVEGENEGAIYDVHGCRVLLLDEEVYDLLRRCEDNVPLEGRCGESEIRLLEALQNEGLGFFDSRPAYVDKLLLQRPIVWMGTSMLPPDFFRADWAITNKCDLDCPFCGRGDDALSWQSCQTCLRRDRGSEMPCPGGLEGLVAQIARLGTRTLHIRGGNPLLAWDYLRRVAAAARHASLDLIVTTPGTGRAIEELLELCRGGGVRLNVLLFGIDEETTSMVCGRKAVLSRQVALVDALTREHFPFFVTFLLTKATRLQRAAILEFTQDRWAGPPSFAEIYLRESMNQGFRLSHVGERVKPLSPWQSADEFFFRIRHNSCLYGHFEIGYDGKLRSCAGFHRVHGDLAQGGLRNALAGTGLYELWELDKGQVQPCEHCALRYACTDCSVFELEGQKDPVVKKAYCPHDPIRGALRACRKNWSPGEFVSSLMEVARPAE